MTREEAKQWILEHMPPDDDTKQSQVMAVVIKALSQISDIKAIINNPMHLQEDVLRYQMICEVVKE